MHVNLNVKAGATVEGKKCGNGGGSRAGMSVTGRFIKRPLLSTPRKRGSKSWRCRIRDDTFYNGTTEMAKLDSDNRN